MKERQEQKITQNLAGGRPRRILGTHHQVKRLNGNQDLVEQQARSISNRRRTAKKVQNSQQQQDASTHRSRGENSHGASSPRSFPQSQSIKVVTNNGRSQSNRKATQQHRRQIGFQSNPSQRNAPPEYQIQSARVHQQQRNTSVLMLQKPQTLTKNSPRELVNKASLNNQLSNASSQQLTNNLRNQFQRLGKNRDIIANSQNSMQSARLIETDSQFLASKTTLVESNRLQLTARNATGVTSHTWNNNPFSSSQHPSTARDSISQQQQPIQKQAQLTQNVNKNLQSRSDRLQLVQLTPRGASSFHGQLNIQIKGQGENDPQRAMSQTRGTTVISRHNNNNNMPKKVKLINKKTVRLRQPSAPQTRRNNDINMLTMQPQRQVINAWQENKKLFMDSLNKKEAAERLKHESKPHQGLHSARSQRQPQNMFHHRYMTHSIHHDQSAKSMRNTNLSVNLQRQQQMLAQQQQFLASSPDVEGGCLQPVEMNQELKFYQQPLSQQRVPSLVKTEVAHVSNEESDENEFFRFHRVPIDDDNEQNNRGLSSNADLLEKIKNKQRSKEKEIKGLHFSPSQTFQNPQKQAVMFRNENEPNSARSGLNFKSAGDIKLINQASSSGASGSNSSDHFSLNIHEQQNIFENNVPDSSRKEHEQPPHRSRHRRKQRRIAPSSSSDDYSPDSYRKQKEGRHVSSKRLDKIILERLALIANQYHAQQTQANINLQKQQQQQNGQVGQIYPQNAGTSQNINSQAPCFMNSTINTLTINQCSSNEHNHQHQQNLTQPQPNSSRGGAPQQQNYSYHQQQPQPSQSNLKNQHKSQIVITEEKVDELNETNSQQLQQQQPENISSVIRQGEGDNSKDANGQIKGTAIHILRMSSSDSDIIGQNLLKKSEAGQTQNKQQSVVVNGRRIKKRFTSIFTKKRYLLGSARSSTQLKIKQQSSMSLISKEKQKERQQELISGTKLLMKKQRSSRKGSSKCSSRTSKRSNSEHSNQAPQNMLETKAIEDFQEDNDSVQSMDSSHKIDDMSQTSLKTNLTLAFMSTLKTQLRQLATEYDLFNDSLKYQEFVSTFEKKVLVAIDQEPKDQIRALKGIIEDLNIDKDKKNVNKSVVKSGDGAGGVIKVNQKVKKTKTLKSQKIKEDLNRSFKQSKVIIQKNRNSGQQQQFQSLQQQPHLLNRQQTVDLIIKGPEAREFSTSSNESKNYLNENHKFMRQTTSGIYEAASEVKDAQSADLKIRENEPNDMTNQNQEISFVRSSTIRIKTDKKPIDLNQKSATIRKTRRTLQYGQPLGELQEVCLTETEIASLSSMLLTINQQNSLGKPRENGDADIFESEKNEINQILKQQQKKLGRMSAFVSQWSDNTEKNCSETSDFCSQNESSDSASEGYEICPKFLQQTLKDKQCLESNMMEKRRIGPAENDELPSIVFLESPHRKNLRHVADLQGNDDIIKLYKIEKEDEQQIDLINKELKEQILQTKFQGLISSPQKDYSSSKNYKNISRQSHRFNIDTKKSVSLQVDSITSSVHNSKLLFHTESQLSERFNFDKQLQYQNTIDQTFESILSVDQIFQCENSLMNRWNAQRKKSQVFDLRQISLQSHEHQFRQQKSPKQIQFYSNFDSQPSQKNFDEIDNFLGLPTTKPIMKKFIQLKKTVRNIQIQALDSELKFLEHLYLRPIIQTKYLMLIKDNSGAEKVQPSSGAQLIQKMEKFNLPEYDNLYKKVLLGELTEFSQQVDKFHKKYEISYPAHSSSHGSSTNSQVDKNLEFRQIRIGAVKILQIFQNVFLQLTKLDLSIQGPLLQVLRQRMLSYISPDFRQWLKQKFGMNLFKKSVTRMQKMDKILKTVQLQMNSPLTHLRARRTLSQFQKNGQNKIPKRESDFRNFIRFDDDSRYKQKYISSMDQYNEMKRLVTIQSMNYYLLGQFRKRNTVLNRLMDKKWIPVVMNLRQAALLAASSAVAFTDQQRQQKQCSQSVAEISEAESSSSEEYQIPYKRMEALNVDKDFTEADQVAVELNDASISFYNQKDSCVIEKQIYQIMPRTTAEWNNNKTQNTNLLIDVFGMQIVFMKIPNFEPLMEVFVPQKLILDNPFQRRRFFQRSKKYQSCDPRMIAKLEKGSNMSLLTPGLPQNKKKLKVKQQSNSPPGSDLLKRRKGYATVQNSGTFLLQQQGQGMISRKSFSKSKTILSQKSIKSKKSKESKSQLIQQLSFKNQRKDTNSQDSLRTDESLKELKYEEIVDFFLFNEKYKQRANNHTLGRTIATQNKGLRMQNMPQSHAILLKSLSNTVKEYADQEDTMCNTLMVAKTQGQLQNISTWVTHHPDRMENYMQIKLDLFELNQIQDFVLDVESEASFENKQERKVNKKRQDEKKRLQQKNKASSATEAKRNSQINYTDGQLGLLAETESFTKRKVNNQSPLSQQSSFNGSNASGASQKSRKSIYHLAPCMKALAEIGGLRRGTKSISQLTDQISKYRSQQTAYNQHNHLDQLMIPTKNTFRRRNSNPSPQEGKDYQKKVNEFEKDIKQQKIPRRPSMLQLKNTKLEQESCNMVSCNLLKKSNSLRPSGSKAIDTTVKSSQRPSFLANLVDDDHYFFGNGKQEISSSSNSSSGSNEFRTQSKATFQIHDTNSQSSNRNIHSNTKVDKDDDNSLPLTPQKMVIQNQSTKEQIQTAAKPIIQIKRQSSNSAYNKIVPLDSEKFNQKLKIEPKIKSPKHNSKVKGQVEEKLEDESSFTFKSESSNDQFSRDESSQIQDSESKFSIEEASSGSSSSLTTDQSISSKKNLMDEISLTKSFGKPQVLQRKLSVKPKLPSPTNSQGKPTKYINIKLMKQDIFKPEKIPKEVDTILWKNVSKQNAIKKQLRSDSLKIKKKQESAEAQSQSHQQSYNDSSSKMMNAENPGYSTTQDQMRKKQLIKMILSCINQDFIIEAVGNYPINLDEPISSDGTTLLIISVKCGLTKVFTNMIRRQADVNKCDKNGNSPLHHAFLLGFKDCIELLIENGADEHLENNQCLQPWELQGNVDY